MCSRKPLSSGLADVARLEVIHLDALRELANVGAGHAATALSLMTGRTVRISVTTVSVATHSALAELFGDRRQQTVVLRLSSAGVFTAGLEIALTERHARQLADLLLDRRAPEQGWLDELAESALRETGNVLAAAYLNALASITGWAIPLSTPELVFLTAGAADEAAAFPGRRALCLETCLTVDGADVVARSHVMLFPERGTLSDVLAAIDLPRC